MGLLTPIERQHVYDLVDGVCAPIAGMEIHFMRVVHGYASPCSQLERAWHDAWKSRGTANIGQEQLSAALSEAECRLEVTTSELDQLKKKINAMDQTIQSLYSQLAQKDRWLTSCHQTIREHEIKTGVKPVIKQLRVAPEGFSCEACGRPLEFCQCAG